MRPSDRERLAEMLRARGVEVQFDVYRHIWAGGRLFAIDTVKKAREWVRRADGSEVGLFMAGDVAGMAEAIAREVGR